MKEPLLRFTNKGIYCARADVYIDPWRPVSKALITHGHADHARWGHTQYICTDMAYPVIKHRLGNISCGTYAYNESFSINGVKFSFHPAGHIPGSAQIRAAYKDDVWVASGDYKTDNDGLSEAFEPIKCNHFITECTFGLPVFQWQDQTEVYNDIVSWWQDNIDAQKVSLILAYSLGKAQRVLQGVRQVGPVYCHRAVAHINEILKGQAYRLPNYKKINLQEDPKKFKGALIIAPPSILNSNFIKKAKDISVAMCSGWMALRGQRRRRPVDKGFVLSDHADWKGLNLAIKETGADHIIATHGYTDIFAKWCQSQGLNAGVEMTEFGDDVIEDTDAI